MAKLIICADIHGSISSWITLKSLSGEKDSIACAGDLFDTRYGSYANPDFSPEQIRDDLKTMKQPFFYAYGNCDTPSFHPDAGHERSFTFDAVNILMHHGHRPLSSIPGHIRLIIQGHTHLPALAEKNGRIFFNPGSLALPRNGIASYGILKEKQLCLMELKTGRPMACLDLNP